MKNLKIWVVFWVLFSQSTLTKAQNSIIEDYHLTGLSPISNFTQLDGFRFLMKTDSSYFMVRTGDPNAYFRKFDSGKWEKMANLSGSFYGVINFKEGKCALAAATTIEVTNCPSSTLLTFNTNFQLYRKCEGDLPYSTYGNAQSKGFYCVPQGPPIITQFSVAGAGLYYLRFTQDNSSSFFTDMYFNSTWQTWQQVPKLPSMNLHTFPNGKVAAFDLAKMYVTDTPDFQQVTVKNLPDSNIYSNITINDLGIFLFNQNGTYWFSQDEGQQWQSKSLPLTDVADVKFEYGNWYIESGENWFFCPDLGANCQRLNPLGCFARMPKADFAVTDSAEIVMAFADIGIFISHDNGLSWENFDAGFARKAALTLRSYKGRLYANPRGDFGYWFQTVGASPWALFDHIALRNSAWYNVLPFSENLDVSIYGKDDVKSSLHSIDGQNWRTCDSMPALLMGISDLANPIAGVGSDFQKIVVQNDSCATLRQVSWPTNANFYYQNAILKGDTVLFKEISFDNNLKKLWYTEDGGLNWQKKDAPGAYLYERLLTFQGKTTYIGKNGDFWTTEDWGTTWQKQSNGLPTTLADLLFKIENDILYSQTLNNPNALFLTKDFGKHWLRIKGNIFPSLYSATFTDSLFAFSDSHLENMYMTSAQKIHAKLDSLQMVTTINDPAAQNLAAIQIAPNPANDLIKITFGELTPVQISVFNQLGQMVLTKNFINVANDSITLNLSNLPDGLYFIKIDAEGYRSVVKRLIINKL